MLVAELLGRSSQVKTCDMARLYGDDLTRTIWRSKRVLDFV